MIDNSIHLANGMNFDRYHQYHFRRFTGFPHYHNTNVDKVCRFLDEWPFKARKEYEEQDKAYDIDYAHGLEIDDEFGDPYGIDRNGMNDIEYRFVLKCHRLAIECNGSLPELIHFISTSLQCSPHDVELGMARHYDKNGKLVGEPDDITLKNINITNIPNDQLVLYLSDELQLAVAADKRVDQIEFYSNTPTTIYTGASLSVKLYITLPIPADINENVITPTNIHTGTSLVTHVNATVNKINNN